MSTSGSAPSSGRRGAGRMTVGEDGAGTSRSRVSCVITMNYDSAAAAEAVAGSLAPDDGGYIRTKVRGAAVIAEASPSAALIRENPHRLCRKQIAQPFHAPFERHSAALLDVVRTRGSVLKPCYSVSSPEYARFKE